MSHVANSGKTSKHPSDWDCGPLGYGPQTRSIMGGGDGIFRWSRCNEMDFRRMYTKYSDDWCLPGKEHENHKLGVFEFLWKYIIPICFFQIKSV